MARRPNIISRLLGNLTIPRASPYKEQGVSGTPIFGGYIQTIERNADWVGRQRFVTSSDIAANVSIVAASIHYFLNLISRPAWSVVPVDDKNPEAVEMAAFVDEVINDMAVPWNRVVRRSGMYRFHGFAIQEWTAKRRDDGRSGLASIEPRPQHTIENWEVSEDGTVTGVWQRSPQTNALIGLPRSKIMYLVEDTLSDSPEGMGMFRHMAEPWNRLKQFLDLETISFERDLRGIPIGRAPITAINKLVEQGKLNKKQADSMIVALENLVKAQVKKPNTGMVLDSQPYESQASDGRKIASVMQWGIELLQGSTNGLTELASAIERVQREMARVLGTEHLMLGEGTTGSRALSEDKSRNLYLMANACLGQIVDTASKDIIDPLWAINGFPDDLKPWFKAEDVTFKDVEAVTTALRDMATAGAVLAPDDPVIDDVRDALGVSRPNREDAARAAMGLDENDDEPAEGGEEAARMIEEDEDNEAS